MVPCADPTGCNLGDVDGETLRGVIVADDESRLDDANLYDGDDATVRDGHGATASHHACSCNLPP